MSGIFRHHNSRYWAPKRRIYSMPRSATYVRLPDPSELSPRGNRKHFYFQEMDGVGWFIEAKQVGHYIKLGTALSSSGGNLTGNAGSTCHLIAINDTTWGVQSYTETWGVA